MVSIYDSPVQKECKFYCDRKQQIKANDSNKLPSTITKVVVLRRVTSQVVKPEARIRSALSGTGKAASSVAHPDEFAH